LATVEDGLNALRIVLACYEANETGRRVVMT
jgi:predicted dehydrogenase